MNKESFIKSTELLGGFICAVLMLLLCFGCSSRKPAYIPVESVVYRTDTVHHTERIIERDTVERTERIVESRIDSIAPILDSIGRMIGYDRWHIIDRSSSLEEKNARLTSTIDSLEAREVNTDKIREPYPVEVVKEVNRLRWWQKALMAVGIIALIGICIALRQLIKSRKLIS